MDLLDFDMREDAFYALHLSLLAANDPEAFDAYMWSQLRRDEEAGTVDPFEEER